MLLQEIQRTLFKFQNDNCSSPVEEYFQNVFPSHYGFIKKLKNTPSLVMTGQYFMHLLFRAYLTCISNNIRFNIRFQSNIYSAYMLCLHAGVEIKVG